jgi:hypothetical protein
MQAAAVLVAALSVPFCFYSVVATWAGCARRHWFVRAVVVAAALLVLLPIRAYEVYVFFLILMGVILTVLAVVRQTGGLGTDSQAVRRAADENLPPLTLPSPDRLNLASDDRARFRFRLADLFLLVLLVAILTATTAYVFRQPMRFEWLEMVLTSTSSGMAALAAAWFVFGRGKLFLRSLAFLAATAAASASWLTGDWLGAEGYLFLQWDKSLLFVPCYLSLVVWYMLWFGSVSPVNWPASPKNKPANKWSRWASRIVLVLLTVTAAILPAGWMYLQLARPLPAPVPVTADPNGFLDLMRAASQLDEAAIPDAKTTPTETLQAFLDQHIGALDQARQALQKPSQVPPDYTPNSYQDDHATKLRCLRSLFEIQIVLADRLKRPEAVARTGVDCLCLADKGSRGGVRNDMLTAFGIEYMATANIGRCRKELSADVCRELIRELEKIGRQRQPVEDFQRRDRDWRRIKFGWREDFWYAVFQLATGPSYGSDLFDSVHQRRESGMQLLLAELALRAHWLEHGHYPERPESLVPEYLSKVPIDPFSGQPLRYRPADGDEPKVYCVGTDEDDDGGQRVPVGKAYYGEGDLFLDAIVDEYMQQ